MKRINYFLTSLLMLLLFSNNALAQGNDVEIIGLDEFFDFIDASGGTPKEVNNLTIRDVVLADDMNWDAISGTLRNAVSVVNGTFTLENCVGGTPDPSKVGSLHFMAGIEFKGGFLFKDLPQMTWTQHFSDSEENNVPKRTHVNGSFKLINCPSMAFPCTDGWNPNLLFGAFERVEGDFIIDGFSGILWNSPSPDGYNTAPNLRYVGGDFVIKNPVTRALDADKMGFPNLQHVGGSIIVDGGNIETLNWQSLTFLGSLEYLGGSISILNIPKMGISGGTDLPFGYCYVKYLIDAGYIDYSNPCVKVELGFSGDLIDISTIGGCSNGVDEGPIYPLPDKEGECESGIQSSKMSKNYANVYVADGQLNIDSSVPVIAGEIYSVTGKEVMNFNEQCSVSISKLPRGIYIVKLSLSNNKVESYKFIK